MKTERVRTCCNTNLSKVTCGRSFALCGTWMKITQGVTERITRSCKTLHEEGQRRCWVDKYSTILLKPNVEHDSGIENGGELH